MSKPKDPASVRFDEAYDLAESLPAIAPRQADRDLINLLAGPCTVDRRWCESPVEELILDALLECQPNTDRRAFRSSGRPTLFQQLDITTIEGVFRLDFALVRPVKRLQVRLAIEIDGFAIHHGSVEAVDGDNKRTRALAKKGWIVIRFSGSEVTRDAGRCAFDANAIMIDNYEALLSGSSQ